MDTIDGFIGSIVERIKGHVENRRQQTNEEIKIKYDELEEYEKQLKDLSRQISARILSIDISNSKGLMVDNTLLAVERLKNIGTVLALLVDKTSEVMHEAQVEFTEAERQIESMFSSQK